MKLTGLFTASLRDMFLNGRRPLRKAVAQFEWKEWCLDLIWSGASIEDTGNWYWYIWRDSDKHVDLVSFF